MYVIRGNIRLLMGRDWLWNLQENLFPFFWKEAHCLFFGRINDISFSDLKQIYTVTLTVNFFQDILLLYPNTAYITISDVLEAQIIFFVDNTFGKTVNPFLFILYNFSSPPRTYISFASRMNLIKNNFPPNISISLTFSRAQVSRSH